MKKQLLLAFWGLTCLFMISCKKNAGSTNGNTGGQSGQLVRIQQGSGAGDTVYLLKYDAQNRLISVTDSINQDTLVGAYNASGLLSSINEHGVSVYDEDYLVLAYNASGQLSEADYTIAGEKDQYIFEYTGNSLTKRTWYSDFGSGGSLSLWRYYTITVTGGNITDVKEYDASNAIQSEHKMTYGTQPNTFKTLTLFNWANRLGAYDIINGELETFFCSNSMATTTWYDGGNNIQYTVTTAPVFNAAQSPTSIIATEKDAGGNLQNLFSWSFSYK